MPNSKAIVTLALGAVYQYRWQRYCRDNWQAYGQRHGYDIICLETPLDSGPEARSPTWQKCLILSQPLAQGYERVIWADADILFSPDAPCLASQVPTERIGAVDEYALFSPAEASLALRRQYQAWDMLQQPYLFSPTAQAFYTNFGLAPAFEQVVQTGLLVLSPKHHRDLLQAVYGVHYSTGRYELGEMPALSHAILQAGCVEWLDWRYNLPFNFYLAQRAPHLLTRPSDPEIGQQMGRALQEAYCLHLAGMGQRLATARAQLDRLEAARRPAVQLPVVAGGQPASPLTTPVAMFLFNRPDTTGRVFEAIRRAKPTQLLLVADGPRPNQPSDLEQCAAARAAVAGVDWDCEVTVNYAPSNLGLKRRVESGLDWVFEQVESAILLEDDCLPAPDFFVFCQTLLERYHGDDRVLSISGGNFQFGHARGEASYYFSRYPLIWGWATWRRAWHGHDPAMRDWPAVRDADWLADFLGDATASRYWAYEFQKTYEVGHTWDYAWTLSCWRRGGLSIIPAANLVSNIGFGAGASHTHQPDAFANLALGRLDFPLRHPDRVERDVEADAFSEAIQFSGHLQQLMSQARARLRAQKAGGRA